VTDGQLTTGMVAGDASGLYWLQFKRPDLMTFAIQPKSFGTFDQHGAEFAPDLDTARDIAFDWSVDEGGAPMIVWRLTSGNPIAWLEVVA